MSLRTLTPIKGGPSVFAPNAVPGASLTLWLDGTDPLGTGTAPANGTFLSTWSDKSGNGTNFVNGTSPTGSPLPQYLDGINLSKGCVRYYNTVENVASQGAWSKQSATVMLTPATPVTVVVTFYLNQTNTVYTSPLAFLDGTGEAINFIFGYNSGSSYGDFSFPGSSAWTAQAYQWSGITAGNWYTLTWTYNGLGANTPGNFQAFLQNVAPSSSSVPAAATTPNSINFLGGDGINARQMDGYFQHVIVYNSVLSTFQRTGLYTWLTTIGSTLPSSTAQIANARSKQFLSTKTYATAADPSVSLTSLSISLWVNTSTSGVTFISKDNESTHRTWYTGLFSGTPTKAGFEVSGNGSAVKDLIGATTINNGAWHHIAYVYDGGGGTMKIYVDGVQDATTSSGVPASLFASAVPIIIGGFQSSGVAQNGMVGNLDWISIYNNYALTLSDVTALYNSGHPPTNMTALASYANCTYFWPIGENTDTEATFVDLKGASNATVTDPSPSTYYSSTIP